MKISNDFVEIFGVNNKAWNIWRILLKPGYGESISQYCLNNNVAAMGWCFSPLFDEHPVQELTERINQIEKWEDYSYCCKTFYQGVDPSVSLFHDKVNIGDVIWMHTKDGRYYYAVVGVLSKWRFYHEARDIDTANQLTNIYWQEVSRAVEIPVELPNNFRRLNNS